MTINIFRAYLAATALLAPILIPSAAFASNAPKSQAPSNPNAGKSKTGDVMVTIGRPRHWTLDDAHYLITGLHNRARQLSIAPPSSIDPNGTNGARSRSTTTEFGVGISFDQIKGVENKMRLKNLENDIADLAEARADEVELKEEKKKQAQALLDISLEEAPLLAESKALQGEIEFHNNQITALNGQLQSIKEEAAAADDGSEIKVKAEKLKERIEAATEKSEEFAAKKREKDLELSQVQARKSILETSAETLDQELKVAVENQKALSQKFATESVSSPTALPNYFSGDEASSNKASEKPDNPQPSFPPSVILDNYVNAENIALAKKLTLLRKDIGEDKTVVFLELPQNIQTAKGASNKRHVQVLWGVPEYCTGNFEDITDATARAIIDEAESERTRIRTNYKQLSEANPNLDKERVVTDSFLMEFNDELLRFNAKSSDLLPVFDDYATLVQRVDPLPPESTSETMSSSNTNLTEATESGSKTELSDAEKKKSAERERFNVKRSIERAVAEKLRRVATQKGKLGELLCQGSHKKALETATEKEDGGTYFTKSSPLAPVAWDLIPRSDAYNISSFNIKQKSNAISAVFSFLTGVGANAQYRQSLETFERFKTQEVFASAFGQGSGEFGWVFNPKPGTKRIASGPKSTYATLTVPTGTSLVKLQAVSCVLKTGTVPYKDFSQAAADERRCVVQEKFDIPIKTEADFWIDSVDYSTADPGETVSVILRGRGFSPFQLSVLVNGTALSQFDSNEVIYGTDANKAPTATVGKVTRAIPDAVKGASGYFQITNPQTVSLHFKMPKTYNKGIPEIVFVTPGKTLSINDLYLRVNDQNATRLKKNTAVFFEKPKVIPAKVEFELDTARQPLVSKVGPYYSTFISGKNFNKVDALYINGVSKATGCVKDALNLDKKNKGCAYTVVSDTTISLIMEDKPAWPILLQGKDNEREISKLLVLEKPS